MSHSTTKAGNRKATKPAKPRNDFPLYPHAVGKWCKTIRGKTFYFGTWADPEGALQEYLAVKDDLHAGRTPKGKAGPDVRDACNSFMSAKRVAMDAGQLSPRSFTGYDATCRFVLAELGANRSVNDLGPGDFQKLYAKLARKHGISTLGREVTITRGIFKHAYDADLIDRPVKFGPTFKVPSKAVVRKHKAKGEQANGKRMFDAPDIRQLLDAADPAVKAMILLGINAGFGNTDCGNLPQSALDLKRGWIDYPRPKTGIDRRVPLWPETVEALKAAIAQRPKHRDPADADMTFLTIFGQRWTRFDVEESKQHGKRVIRAKSDDEVCKRFGKLLREQGVHRKGIGFYALRHTFETVAGGCKDQVAVDAIMGHADPSMGAVYRHGIDDDRLRAVVDHVHGWLFS